MQRESLQCPQCGSELPLYFKYSKMITCPYCKSTIFLEDDAVKLAGIESVINDEPSLLHIYKAFEYEGDTYRPIGRLQYRVDRYLWDEWWVVGNDGEAFWLSVDDGDYIAEKEIPFELELDSYDSVELGDRVSGWIVTEKGEGILEAFEGELPEVPKIGEKHHYIHLSDNDGTMLTAEFYDGQKSLYMGKWIDPFEIREILK